MRHAGIAFRRGLVPEVIDNGVAGFIVRDVDEAVSAVQQVHDLDRAAVRRVFESRFTAERMAMDYVEIYRRLPGVRTEAARLRRVTGRGVGLHAVS